MNVLKVLKLLEREYSRPNGPVELVQLFDEIRQLPEDQYKNLKAIIMEFPCSSCRKDCLTRLDCPTFRVWSAYLQSFDTKMEGQKKEEITKRMN